MGGVTEQETIQLEEPLQVPMNFIEIQLPSEHIPSFVSTKDPGQTKVFYLFREEEDSTLESQQQLERALNYAAIHAGLINNPIGGLRHRSDFMLFHNNMPELEKILETETPDFSPVPYFHNVPWWQRPRHLRFNPPLKNGGRIHIRGYRERDPAGNGIFLIAHVDCQQFSHLNPFLHIDNGNGNKVKIDCQKGEELLKNFLMWMCRISSF